MKPLPKDIQEIRAALRYVGLALDIPPGQSLQRSQLLNWMVDAAEEAGLNSADPRAVVANARSRWPGLDELIAELRSAPEGADA